MVYLILLILKAIIFFINFIYFLHVWGKFLEFFLVIDFYLFLQLYIFSSVDWSICKKLVKFWPPTVWEVFTRASISFSFDFDPSFLPNRHFACVTRWYVFAFLRRFFLIHSFARKRILEKLESIAREFFVAKLVKKWFNFESRFF